MSDYKIKNEIKRLQEMGIAEEFATLVVASKYGNLEMASGVLEGFTEENQDIKELIEEMGFKPFEAVDTTGYMVEPISSSSVESEIVEDNQINIEELSNDIIESNNDKNQD